jgi:hypothetical protein
MHPIAELPEMKIRGSIKRFVYTFSVLLQAIIYKLTQPLFSQPILILKRKIKKKHPFSVCFEAFQRLRPALILTTKPFSVETGLNDFEVGNASQRLIHLKHHLVSNSVGSKEKYLSEMKAFEFNFEESRGLLSSYNYSEAVSNIVQLFLRDSEGEKEVVLGPHLEDLLKRFLDHISDHPEYYYLTTNNHLLNNARALLLGGLLLRNPSYISRGVEVLNCALFMFPPTGVFRERSSHYHLIVFLWLQDILSVFNQIQFNGVDRLKEKLSVLLAANSEVTAVILDHSCSLIPLVGDVSPDESPNYTSQFARHLSLSLPRKPSQKEEWRTSGGWYFLKDAAWSAVCCPQDKLFLEYPTHGHDDWGGFCLSKAGDDILIDVGRYSYSKDPLSLYQVSREGHNSVFIELDGKKLLSRAIYRGGSVSREIASDGKALLLTEKYRKRGFQYQWTRRMACHGGLFKIVDNLLVSRPCKAVFTFFFSKRWYSLHGGSVKFNFGQDHLLPEGSVKNVQEVEYSEEYLWKGMAIRLRFSVNIADSFTLHTGLI